MTPDIFRTHSSSSRLRSGLYYKKLYGNLKVKMLKTKVGSNPKPYQKHVKYLR